MALIEAAVAAVVTIGVGVYKRRGAKQDARRQEAFSKVEALTVKAQEIETLAVQYHLKDGADPECPALATQLRQSLKALGCQVTDLSHLLNDKSILNSHTRFRIATSGHLDLRERKCSVRGDEVINAIEGTCISLCSLAQTLFHSKFK
jgi:hypothetical protein